MLPAMAASMSASLGFGFDAISAAAAITWPEFSKVHPFAPADDVAGYRELIDELLSWLSALTGYAGGLPRKQLLLQRFPA